METARHRQVKQAARVTLRSLHLRNISGEITVQRRATQRKARTSSSQDRGPCCKTSDYLLENNNHERLLLHHLGIAWCRASIARYESASQRVFDMVVYTRPDLVFWRPTLPWCEFAWKRQIVACHEPGCDMAWFAPRRASDLLMGTAELHLQRPPPRNMSDAIARLRPVFLAASIALAAGEDESGSDHEPPDDFGCTHDVD